MYSAVTAETAGVGYAGIQQNPDSGHSTNGIINVRVPVTNKPGCSHFWNTTMTTYFGSHLTEQ